MHIQSKLQASSQSLSDLRCVTAVSHSSSHVRDISVHDHSTPYPANFTVVTLPTGTCMGSINFMDIRMTSDADAAINGRPAAVGAGTTPHAAVDAANSGSLGLIEQLSCSVVRTVVSHSKGGVSVLVAHPNAPLLATGTTSQVVKVWTDAGDSVSLVVVCGLLHYTVTHV